MGLIWGTILSVLAVAGGILISTTARVVGDDLKEWLPWITQRLVAQAVSWLPEEERDRYEEEWRAHINKLPGNLARVYAAWGFLSASKAINHIALSGDTTSIEEVTRRARDLAISVLCLFLLLPLMAVISICIKLDSRGPVFFKQKRLGANNLAFDLLKFRSLYVEQTERLGHQLTRAVDHPRITRVGRFLRMTSMDELPQFLNVIRGQMSLVGPPALPPSSADDTSAESETPIFDRLRHLKPGLTGWAQINRRGDEPKLIADLYYQRNRSLKLDFLIIARTLFALETDPKDLDLWPKTSLSFFSYIFCLFLIAFGLLAAAFLILMPAVIHFLGLGCL